MNNDTKLSIDQRIGAKLNVPKGMKLSVVWRQLDSAIADVCEDIGKYNVALSKTLPLLKKQAYQKDLEGVVEGKYIKFPDGSQARF